MDKFTLCLLDQVPVLSVGRVNTKPYSNFREFYRWSHDSLWQTRQFCYSYSGVVWTLNKGRQLWELTIHYDTWLISIWKITLGKFCYYQVKEPHPPSNCCFWVSILVDNSCCWLVVWAKLTCDLCTVIAWSWSLRNIWLLPELTSLIICIKEIDITIISWADQQNSARTKPLWW